MRALFLLVSAWRRCDPKLLRVGVAIWIVRVLVLTPTSLAADPESSQQELRVEDVLIEGKLSSPQAVPES
jgi:hypothetical protein